MEVELPKEKIKQVLKILGVIAALWFLFIQNGGDTITILNRSSKDICEVYFAFSPEENGWGRNRIISDIKKSASKTVLQKFDETCLKRINELISDMSWNLTSELQKDEGVKKVGVDCKLEVRYEGQSSTIIIDLNKKSPLPIWMEGF